MTQPRIVFLCSPGNPTGTRTRNARLVRLRNRLLQDVLLVIDRVYAEFDDQNYHPVLDLTRHGVTVVTRTLSKAYGLARMRKLLNPNNVSSTSRAMTVVAIKDLGAYEACRSANGPHQRQVCGAFAPCGKPC